jgi:hypothetical protein
LNKRTLLPAFFLLFSGAVSRAQAPEGELVLRSFRHSFPGRVGEPVEAGGDWRVSIGGEVFCWAGGRLLPPSLLEEKDQWEPHDFSPYPEDAPSPLGYGPEEIERIRREGSAEVRLSRDNRYYGFLTALYGGSNRREAEAQLVRIPFLGRGSVPVHREIAEALKRIDDRISGLAAKEEEVRAFLSAIDSVECYNWRQIRGSRRMSYHSWGLAVDIRPRQLGNKAIYWFWEQARSEDWMLRPPEQRWQPPMAVIRAFEDEGFIWGGKWELYDNMHFEFRPELHELNRLLAAESASYRVVKPGGLPNLHHIAPPGLEKR